MDNEIKELSKFFCSGGYEKYLEHEPNVPMHTNGSFDKLFALYRCIEISAWGDCRSCPFNTSGEETGDADCRNLAMAWAAIEIERLSNIKEDLP